jgi:hypothetical protein
MVASIRGGGSFVGGERTETAVNARWKTLARARKGGIADNAPVAGAVGGGGAVRWWILGCHLQSGRNAGVRKTSSPARKRVRRSRWDGTAASLRGVTTHTRRPTARSAAPSGLSRVVAAPPPCPCAAGPPPQRSALMTTMQPMQDRRGRSRHHHHCL